MIMVFRTARSMIIWQCLNQAFNTIVNYNRNTQHNTPTDIETIKMSFVAATVASCTVAICFKRFITFRGSSIDVCPSKIYLSFSFFLVSKLFCFILFLLH